MSQLILNQIQKNTQSYILLSKEINELKGIYGNSNTSTNSSFNSKINNQQDILKKINFFQEEINKINFNLEEINSKLEYIMHYIDTNKLSSQPDFEPM